MFACQGLGFGYLEPEGHEEKLRGLRNVRRNGRTEECAVCFILNQASGIPNPEPINLKFKNVSNPNPYPK